jgi:hypothetical protein
LDGLCSITLHAAYRYFDAEILRAFSSVDALGMTDRSS